MKVGYQYREDWGEIVERKLAEERAASVVYWGYGGSVCHPLTQVQPFAAQGQPITVLMIHTASAFVGPVAWADGASADGKSWSPIPTGVRTAGRYALVLRSLEKVDFRLDLAAYEVAIGSRQGMPLPDYLRLRVDKACARLSSVLRTSDPHVVNVVMRADLVAPYAVLLRTPDTDHDVAAGAIQSEAAQVTSRVSFEKATVDALLSAVGPPPDVAVYRGMGAVNRTVPDGWTLSALQSFQFGDLRLESSTVRVVVEVESAGGVTNLAKYWPLLGSSLRDKRFVLIHLFMMSSRGDYLAHREIWTFLRDRMRADLRDRCALEWGEGWTAEMLTYGPGSDSDGIATAANHIREALSESASQTR
jgi:hypothetical protein